jgi:arylsulfatase A-like enzyme
VTHNAPFRAGKGYLYEGGLRVPLIVHGPGLATRRVIDTPFINTDWLPTLLELAGASLPGKAKADRRLDGVSQATLLVSGRAAAAAARPLYWHIPHYTNQGSRPSGAMRHGRWKLIEQYDDGRAELFDLESDPAEARDVAVKEPTRVAAMRARLREWRKAVGAQENTPNPAVDAALYNRIYVDFDASRFDPLRADEQAWSAMAAWREQMDAAVRSKLPVR